MVEPDEESIQRVLRFGDDPSPDKIDHQYGNQCDRKQCACCHGKGLGECQRGEEQPLLAREGKDRQEGDHYQCQGKEDGAAYDLGSFDDHRDTLFVLKVAPQFFLLFVYGLVGILYHDDGGIDHGTDGNGDTAKTHDVRSDAKEFHKQEGQADGERQDDEYDERGAQVHQEKPDDDDHDDTLFDQRAFEGIDRF